MRRSRRADIVISNHALVMINAAYAPPVDPERDQEGGGRPMRYVFDEGIICSMPPTAPFQSI